MVNFLFEEPGFVRHAVPVSAQINVNASIGLWDGRR